MDRIPLPQGVAVTTETEMEMDKATVELAIEAGRRVAESMAERVSKYDAKLANLAAALERDTVGDLHRLGKAIRPAVRVKGAGADANHHRLTQSQAAEAVGVSTATIQRAIRVADSFATASDAKAAYEGANVGTVQDWLALIGSEMDRDEFLAKRADEAARRKVESEAVKAERAARAKHAADHPVETILATVRSWSPELRAELVAQLQAMSTDSESAEVAA